MGWHYYGGVPDDDDGTDVSNTDTINDNADSAPHRHHHHHPEHH